MLAVTPLILSIVSFVNAFPLQTPTFVRRAPSTLGSYNDWTYKNCYIDSVSERVLPVSMPLSGPTTVERCLDACNAARYEYGGLEFGSECYCGRSLPTEVATDGRCYMTCQRNDQEYCGGPNGINVYESSNPANRPRNIQSYNGWSFSGCFVDSVENRILPVRTDTEPSTMTIESCLNACGQLGYYYAGLEYSEECYCGASLPTVRATDARCNMLCNGNPLEYCGGANGLSVYTWGSGQSPQLPPPPPPAGENPPPPVGSNAPRETTFTSTYTSISIFESAYTTFTTTLVRPTTYVTTIPVPITETATIPETLSIPTTVEVLELEFTTVTLPVVQSTTIVQPLSQTSTIPVPITASTTIVQPVTLETTLIQPIETTSPSIIVGGFTSTPSLTVTRASATLSIFTGTTSFADPFTTIYQPIIILTTLVRTFTTLTAGQPTFIPTSTTVPITFTTTLYDVEPTIAQSSDIELFTSTSYDLEPFVTSSLGIGLYTTSSESIASFTSSTPVRTTIPVPTTVYSSFTSTSFEEELATETLFSTSTTTYTTTVTEPITLTTTITTAAM